MRRVPILITVGSEETAIGDVLRDIRLPGHPDFAMVSAPRQFLKKRGCRHEAGPHGRP